MSLQHAEILFAAILGLIAVIRLYQHMHRHVTR